MKCKELLYQDLTKQDQAKRKCLLFVRLSGDSLPPSTGSAVLLKARRRSHVLWVVVQTGDELFHRFALEADLIDRGEQGEPAESEGNLQ